MASPPHSASLNIPRKRGSVSSVASSNKRRKPSNLRNAFSPEHELAGSPLRFSRSPSVDSVATTSVANGVGGRRKGRGRGGDGGSVTGSARGGKGGSEGRSMMAGEGGDRGEDGEEDDEDEEGEGMDAVLEGGMGTEAAKKQEKENERILMEAMSENQSNRYAIYRRIKLKKEIVRKITNQTLSQSVPQPVIITVGSYTKSFIGELIDRALVVRDEWAAARTHIPNPALPTEVLSVALRGPKGYKQDAKPTTQDWRDAGLWNGAEAMKGEGVWKEVGREEGLGERLKMEDKGPLTPAHLREALRRYKRDRDGGGAGVAGMSLEGVERARARLGGKRLFR
ncbi:hTAFII28-like protein conserved region-domain-containing protein [Clohesyomyces aquaticus]|uniref:HTAFII28-like protein conserved region-domain-containing protein n=1 Tax=Clohesyomyces aquaticus TaxID=1231657 RepID=A0A1Y1Y632_9PLEO|nr:hTAFII28-like protein conserved region-domain-containing protein [Clohesyomyces aquaticus]